MNRRGITIYHPYVAEPHETEPYPAVQFAYSAVTYSTAENGVSDCLWIIPGTIEAGERLREKLRLRRLSNRTGVI